MSHSIPFSSAVVASASLPMPVSNTPATRRRRHAAPRRRGSGTRTRGHLKVLPLRSQLQQIKTDLLPRNRYQHIPWLGQLHKVADGVLLAAVVSTAVLCALVLNLQISWSRSYGELEEAQQLRQQLVETITVLRASLRSHAQGSDGLSTTRSEDLIFMEPPPVHLPVALQSQPLINYNRFLRGY